MDFNAEERAGAAARGGGPPDARSWLYSARCRLSTDDYASFSACVGALRGAGSQGDKGRATLSEMATTLWRADFQEGPQKHEEWILAFTDSLPAVLRRHWKRVVSEAKPGITSEAAVEGAPEALEAVADTVEGTQEAQMVVAEDTMLKESSAESTVVTGNVAEAPCPLAIDSSDSLASLTAVLEATITAAQDAESQVPTAVATQMEMRTEPALRPEPGEEHREVGDEPHVTHVESSSSSAADQTAVEAAHKSQGTVMPPNVEEELQTAAERCPVDLATALQDEMAPAGLAASCADACPAVEPTSLLGEPLPADLASAEEKHTWKASAAAAAVIARRLPWQRHTGQIASQLWRQMTGQPESASASMVIHGPHAATPSEAFARLDAEAEAAFRHAASAVPKGHTGTSAAVGSAAPAAPAVLDQSSQESDTIEVPLAPRKRKQQEAAIADTSADTSADASCQPSKVKKASTETFARETNGLPEDEVRLLRDEIVALRARLIEAEGAVNLNRQDKPRQAVAEGLVAEPAEAPRALCVICRQPPWKPQVSALCGHFACDECWGRWVCVKFECPVCRAKVRPNNLIRLRAWGDS